MTRQLAYCDTGAEDGADVPAAASAAQALAQAWHLRQRDTPRALRLAALAEGAGAEAAARAALVRAEAAWLHADLSAAWRHAEAARQACAASDDRLGHADALVLLAVVALDRADLAAYDGALQEAAALARAAGDAQRVACFEGPRAYLAAVRDADAADAAWSAALQGQRDHADPAIAQWACDVTAQIAFQRGRFADAVAGFQAAAAHARAAGQLRRAITALCNAGACWNNLGDHDAALQAIEPALALARRSGWPASFGTCLYMVGNALRHLGRLDAAQALLDEAQAVLAPLAGSRQQAQAACYAGELALERQDPAAAEALFGRVVAYAARCGQTELAVVGLRGRADALCDLGRRAEAAEAARMSLEQAQAQGLGVSTFDALCTLARAEPDAATAHLLRAVAVGRAIDGFVIPAGTWTALAREQRAHGDLAAACDSLLQAAASREQELAADATLRAMALAVRHETARAQAESERLRAQAEAEARRRAELQALHDTQEQLGRIGQQITSQRDLDAVCQAIAEPLHRLVGAAHVSIWLLDDEAALLQLRHGHAGGQRLAAAVVPLAHPHAPLARCAREGREVTLADGAADDTLPGVRPGRALQLAPLRVRERTIGVLCLQPSGDGADAERERLVLRSLCAYGAIALDNAVSHEQLARARERAESAAQHKSEFLAHISHDLRTPLATLHGCLETLQLKAGELAEPARRRYLALALDHSHKVGRLARSLLELARLESGVAELSLERFSIADLAQDVLLKFQPAAMAGGQRLQLGAPWPVPTAVPDVQADIGMIERVLTNLLDNAIRHTPPGTEVRVELAVHRAQVCVGVLDSGPGLSPAPRGAGLGLQIVRCMLRQHGSELLLRPRPGYATVLEFCLPVAHASSSNP